MSRGRVGGQDDVDVSVVLPCFNEEACVEALTAEIRAVLERVGGTFEILYVDDASTDRTLAVLTELRAKHPMLRIIRHAINSGESAATATGFRFARGRIIVTMDSDQQNDPADIPRFLAALEGRDAVAGMRRRREDSFVRRMSSKIGNGFRNFVTGVPVSDAGCTYRALRAEALHDVPVFNGMHRFLPTLLTLQGFSVGEIETNHRPRTTGQSKYGISNRMFRGITDCLVMRWWRRRIVSGKRVGGEVGAAPARP